MKSLILKDIYNILHNMRSMAVLLLFFIIFMIPQGGTAAYQVTCCLLCSMMIMTTFSFDNISKWEKYALVMPITKKDLVTAKFLTLIIFSVFGAVTGFVLGIAGGVVFKSFHINSPEEWITLLAVAGIGMVIGIFFGSLVIPLLFKFGADNLRWPASDFSSGEHRKEVLK